MGYALDISECLIYFDQNDTFLCLIRNDLFTMSAASEPNLVSPIDKLIHNAPFFYNHEIDIRHQSSDCVGEMFTNKNA